MSDIISNFTNAMPKPEQIQAEIDQLHAQIKELRKLLRLSKRVQARYGDAPEQPAQEG